VDPNTTDVEESESDQVDDDLHNILQLKTWSKRRKKHSKRKRKHKSKRYVSIEPRPMHLKSKSN
jgi:hypothetical protein